MCIWYKCPINAKRVFLSFITFLFYKMLVFRNLSALSFLSISKQSLFPQIQHHMCLSSVLIIDKEGLCVFTLWDDKALNQLSILFFLFRVSWDYYKDLFCQSIWLFTKSFFIQVKRHFFLLFCDVLFLHNAEWCNIYLEIEKYSNLTTNNGCNFIL